MRRDAAVVVVVAGVLAACMEEDVRSGIYAPWMSETETLGDTTVVRTLDGSVWGDTMVLVPEVEIGVLDGDERYLFGSVRAIDVDSDGNVYVLDLTASSVRVYSPEGAYLRGFGRAGQGPGELDLPQDLALTPFGDVVVRDRSRFTVFSTEGEVRETWPVASNFTAFGTPFALSADGRLTNHTLREALLRYDLGGEVLDTIPIPSRGFEAPMVEAAVSSGGGTARYYNSVPFFQEEVWSLAGGGILFGLNESYTFEHWDPDGRVLRIERNAPRAMVHPEERDAERTRITESFRRLAGSDWRWDGPEIPGTKPAYTTLLPGRDGSIWVFRYTEATEGPNPDWDPSQPDGARPTVWTSPVVADVFDADGRFLGPVKFPESLGAVSPFFVLETERIWAGATHELGYPQVVRFRLEPQGGS